MSNISIKSFIEKFNAGEFDSKDTTTQIAAGWYDWFCKNESLGGKTKTLGRKVKKLAVSKLINQDTMYVFFKNNCPCNGRLYDSFSICRLSNDDVLYWVAPSSGYYDDNYRKVVISTHNGAKFADGTSGEKVFDNFSDALKAFGL
jgi:hypothetical protein